MMTCLPPPRLSPRSAIAALAKSSPNWREIRCAVPRGGGERNGVPLLPAKQNKILVTLEIVNALRDELP